MNKSVYEKHYKQLVGYTLTDVVILDEEDAGDLFDDVQIALFFEKKGKQPLVAYLLSDEEGNGTGHLDIQAYDDPQA